MTKSATERAEAQQWAEYVQHLENEVERLKAEIDLLRSQLNAYREPKP